MTARATPAERPAPLTLTYKVATALLAATLVLCFIWLFSQRRMEQLAELVRQVGHTQVVLRTLEQTFSETATAETNARGFVLTEDPDYLARYEGARRRVAARVDALKSLTADNASQQARLRAFEPLVGRRLAMLDTVVAARRTRGLERAAAIVRSGVGKALTDSVRLMIDEMEREEERLLALRSAGEVEGARRVLQVMSVGFLLALTISGGATLLIRHDFGQRTRASAALEEARQHAEEARARAEEASRAKSDFLARMSHELRTPLNSIIGFSNVLLKNRGALRPQDVVYLERIGANGKQLLSLISDILDLSKVEAGRVQLERAPVALDELVSDVVAGFEGQLQEREGVALVAELPSPLQPIETDAGKLRQVLLNLVGNALKFTERGQVTVRVVADPSTGAPVRVDVADTGVGIPAERRDAVFEAFEQADADVSRRYGGTGLGLAIARSLCTAMGYRLELRENPGGGSLFSVVLTPDGTTGAGDGTAPRRPSQTPVSLYRVR